MNKTSRRRALRLSTQTAELMLATPQVIAHRLARMATGGPGTSRRDQQELHRMSAEKVAAFVESWSQMALQMLKANQQMAQAFMIAPWVSVRTMSGAARIPASIAKQMQSSALQVLSSGVEPVRKRAAANAKRLRRAKSC